MRARLATDAGQAGREGTTVTQTHPGSHSMSTIRKPGNLLVLTSIVPTLLLGLAAIGTRTGVWHFGPGLKLLAVAAGLGVVIALVAAWFWWRSRRLSTGPGGPACVLALLLALAPALYVGQQILLARSLPLIHDISTDLDDPPVFRSQAILNADRDNPLDFDPETTVQAQRAAYPGVEPLLSGRDCDAMFAAAYNLATDLGWEIAEADPGEGYIEATATTRWFGFKDDVHIRLRAIDTGCRVDVRSISRVGLSDVGANAARIIDFLRRLAGNSI